MSDLLDAFQAATALSVKLKMTPRWRRRKRRQLQAELAALCVRADLARARLGASPDAPPLSDTFAEFSAEKLKLVEDAAGDMQTRKTGGR